ncbi:MAG: HAD hydrolase-like protein, partial [Oscillospiraceae bacterium]|nr:HAD hydrolase-like protein [Oscillospiraceae bacterium]
HQDIGFIPAFPPVPADASHHPVLVGKPIPKGHQGESTPEETVVIGDRIYTDVACGVNAGIDSILVLSGETTLADAEKSDIRPTAIFDDITAILRVLKGEQ